LVLAARPGLAGAARDSDGQPWLPPREAHPNGPRMTMFRAADQQLRQHGLPQLFAAEWTTQPPATRCAAAHRIQLTL
jgi:hypothetical protein